jgi:hypothetical protein
MKTIVKKGLYFLVNIVLIASIVSCNDPSNIEEGTDAPTTEPYDVTLGFGLVLDPVNNLNSQQKSTTIEHNFTKTGYKVDIKGNLVNGDIALTNVDLTEPIFLEVTGSVTVTVKHPDYKQNKLSDVAYYSADREDVDTYVGSGMVSVSLELVQGYVAVEATEMMGVAIENVKIGKDDVALNTVYYIGNTKKEVTVEVEVFGGEINGRHDNIIGEGVVYEVTFQDAIGGISKSKSQIKSEDLLLKKTRNNIELLK